MTDLDKRKCVPCEGGLDALTKEKAKSYLKKLDKDWILNKDARSIERTYSRKNHYELSSLINLIIAISHSEDHHPEITFGYNTARVNYFTYALDGLSEKDFIFAAKIDKVLAI